MSQLNLDGENRYRPVQSKEVYGLPKPKKNNELYKIHQVDMNTVMIYQEHEVGQIFVILLKAPFEADKFNDDHRHYTKSNINVCYATPRSPKKPRDWYEMQLNVSADVRTKAGYPYKGIPFYVVTDDGFGFMAHTTSANNKQLAAVGDELILGKWLKGRLVSEGLIEPVENTEKDIERKGMITQEMLIKYGCNAIAFQKTDLRIPDSEQPKNSYEVWTIKLVQVDDEE